VTGKIFKKIQWDFYRFLKDNAASCKPRPKRKKNPPTKAIKVTLPKNNFEPSAFTEKIHLCRNHQISRMKDWHGTYGQGMYE
jgi:hypothetical protein